MTAWVLHAIRFASHRHARCLAIRTIRTKKRKARSVLLAPYVERTWFASSGGGVERVLPTGAMHLVIRIDAALAFYKEAFGVAERFRLTEPSGRVGHAELDFGGATVMVSEEYPESGIVGPQTLGGTTVAIYLHVDDCDAAIARAVKGGGTLVRAPQDHFYGERSGTVRDPFGHDWLIGHEIEKLTPEEMQRRYTALFV